MFARLLILFITVPLVELYLLLELNDWTGSAVTTISLVLLTGFLGAWLAKRQGLQTLSRIQQALREGRLPTDELLDGAMVLLAAALLVTPGLLTDAFGFSLLLPPCRPCYRRLLRRMTASMDVQFRHFEFNSTDDVVDGMAQPSREERPGDSDQRRIP